MSEDFVHASIAVFDELERAALFYVSACKSGGVKSTDFKLSYLLIMTFSNVVSRMQIPADLEENAVTRLRGIAAVISRVQHPYSDKLVSKITKMLQRFASARNIPKKEIREIED